MGEQVYPSSSVLSALRSLGVVIPIQEQFVVDGSENFRVRIACSLANVVVTLAARVLLPDGSISPLTQTFAPTGDRTINSFDVPIGQGAILSAVMYASQGTPVRGQCFAQLGLIQGLGASATPLAVLLQDYITSFQALAWPGSPIRSSVDGPGWQHTFSVPDPPAGSSQVLTVPTGARWELRSLTAQLTTDAVVGNRFPEMRVISGGLFPVTVPIQLVPGPNWIVVLTWSQASGFTEWADGTAAPTVGVASTTFPAGYRLFAGDQIQIAARRLDAADQYNDIVCTVEEWLELN